MSWANELRGRLIGRVIASTALSAAFSAALALVVAIAAIDHLVTEQADTRLRGATNVLAGELLEAREEHGTPDSMIETLADENQELVTSGIRLAVFRGGRLVTGDTWVRPVAAGECATHGALGSRSRGCARNFEGHVLVAAELSNDASLPWIYGSAGVMALLVGALLSAFASVPLTRLALRPLSRLSLGLRRVKPGLAVPEELARSVETAEVEAIRRTLVALLEQGRASLEQSQAFAANAAHELRTPLTTIRAELELLIEEAGTSLGRDALERIERRLAHLSSLVERLLVLASPVEGAFRGEPVALSDLAQEVVAGLTAEQRQRVRLEVTGEALVRGDPTLLYALLLNAIDNGLKFSGPSVVIVKVGEDGGLVLVDVVDSGPGVPSTKRTRVFEPFYRLAGGMVPGHGLGLALIRHIAAAHAGRARFLPARVGAHLRLELPVWRPSAPSSG
jgi:two-component system, OmpR family, sensor kinase